ncbi:hypothetical protein ACFORJ_03260 [Corynebacterium hansenii]|uniref:Transposase n=1 Tax=Corynebacterium hansenii TaxID=394964 RepID=A0ABV7ZLN8_9CORY|nr:hypothetical protein [Corynebacterium hansenii]WJY98980.1 hypothetical protein CHAN_01745 [Corynebacterium hansenii]
MFDEINNHSEPSGAAPTGLNDDQRHALFVAQLQVLPDDWSRTKSSWLEFGRVLRAEFSGQPALRAA